MSRTWPPRLETPFGDLVCGREGEAFVLEGPGPEALDFGLGWLHSRLRGQTCQWSRALVQGTLGETLKTDAAVAETDRFVRFWNFDQGLDAEAARLDAGSRARLLAYAQGFNQEQAERRRLPWEPAPTAERWQMEDSLLLGRTLGFFSWWETEGKKAVYLHDLIKTGAPREQLKELFPDFQDSQVPEPWDVLPDLPRLSPQAEELLGLVPRWRASRAWAVKGRFTRSGFPLLAGSYQNDVSQVPGTFLQVVLRTGAEEWRGLSLPGIPGLVCGRNRHLAWHAAVSFDPAVEFRRGEGRTWSLEWTGRGGLGTLGALMETMNAGTVGEVRTIWTGRGSALVDLLAADCGGAILKLATGPRQPAGPGSLFLHSPPAAVDDDSEAGYLFLDTGPQACLTHEDWPPFSRAGLGEMEELLNGLNQTADRKILETIRFLLPETPAGTRLRTWKGQWNDDEENRLFSAVHEEIVREFWGPWGLNPRSGVYDRLRGGVLRLINAPASQSLGTHKNKKLAEAVRRAMEKPSRDTKGPTPKAGGPGLWHQYPRGGQKFAPTTWPLPPGSPLTLLRCHEEDLGSAPRTFWSSSAWACDLALSTIRIRNWDGGSETQPPQAPQAPLTRFNDL